MAAGEFCIGGEAPSFNSYGDEYDKKMAIDPKYKGRQFLVNNKAEFWDKDRAYLSQGDRYEDPGTLEKVRRCLSKAKRVCAERPCLAVAMWHFAACASDGLFHKYPTIQAHAKSKPLFDTVEGTGTWISCGGPGC